MGIYNCNLGGYNRLLLHAEYLYDLRVVLIRDPDPIPTTLRPYPRPHDPIHDPTTLR